MSIFKVKIRFMHEKYTAVIEALRREGFHHPPSAGPHGQPFDCTATPYALNAELSVKLDNLARSPRFLQLSGAYGDERATALKTMLLENGLDVDEFFWVNFFEKGKE